MQNGTQFAPSPYSSAGGERRPRLWPGVLIVLLYWAVLKLPLMLLAGSPAQVPIMFMGSMAVPALFLLWWCFFSRVSWSDRFVGLLAFALIGAACWYFYHPTMQGGGDPMSAIMAMCFNIFPVVMTGWVLWLLIARSLSRQVRFAGLAVVFALGFGFFTILRFDGLWGEFAPQFSYRWTPTAGEQYASERPAYALPGDAGAASAPAAEVTAEDWPAFRGPARDGRRPGVRIATDWAAHPPKQVWRRKIGDGWGSFTVVGPRLYTQEQFGKAERVACLDAATGKTIWAHEDAVKHQDNESGEGPRATPTYDNGRIYSLGGTGILNCLDAGTGKPLWSKDIKKDAGIKEHAGKKDETGGEPPHWGFSSSPLVANGVVVVFAGGPNGKGVLAYQIDSGKLAWAGGDISHSYCSLQPAKVAAVDQFVVTSSEGLTALDPASGKTLWQYEWVIQKEMDRVTQPAQISDTDFLIGSSFGAGSRRVRVSHEGDTWKVEPDPVWESTAISPYYNDAVVHKGHLYGFNGIFLVCIDLKNGKLAWKERGYDAGQVLLLPDQDLLLVQAEKGDVALVEAKPEARKELGRFHAIDGKTWNHPVVARGKLYVRNGEYAACYDLAGEGAAVAVR
jgi:outer membrane protein assembly factor BamB